jgi:hypothetical protein
MKEMSAESLSTVDSTHYINKVILWPGWNDVYLISESHSESWGTGWHSPNWTAAVVIHREDEETKDISQCSSAPYFLVLLRLLTML